MKINITSDASRSINGYKNYFTHNNDHLDLNDIVTNCCEEIIFTGIDYIPQDKVESILDIIISKLRLGGKIFISGLNIDALGRLIVAEQVSEEDASNMLAPIKSIRSRYSLSKLIKQKNLTIEYSIAKGLVYEISAIRK